MEEFVARMDVGYIHNSALRIMEKIGLQLPDEKTRSQIADTKGIRIKGERILISPELAESIATDMRATKRPPRCKKWQVAGGGACHWLLDFDGVMKKFTSQKLIDAFRWTSACEDLGINATIPGLPAEEPGPMQALVQMRLIAEYFGTTWKTNLSDLSVAAFALEMLKVLNRKFSLCPHVISPLRLAGDEWDLTVAWLGKIKEGAVEETITVANMPAVGATAPCDYNAAWAQSMAETLGGAVVLKALGAKKVEACGTLYPFDLRTGLWVYGSPEHALITLMEAKLREFYGLPRRNAKSLTTTAVAPNVQASSGKMFHTTLAAMAGYRTFSGAGVLGIDDIWSPAQRIIDADIVHSVKHIIDGEYPSRPVDAVKAVREGLDEAGFLTAGLTLQRHRRLYWSPKLFEHSSLGQWLASGKPDLVNKANRMARERFEETKAPQPKLDRDRAKALDDIIAQARKTLIK